MRIYATGGTCTTFPRNAAAARDVSAGRREHARLFRKIELLLGFVCGRCFVWLLPGLLCGVQIPSTALSAPVAQSDEDAEEQRLRKLNDRFLQLLKRRPRAGTALDKVYAFHVDHGTLDDFVSALNKTVADNPRDGASWMVLGMIQMRRGQDSAAQAAFAKATQVRPEDSVAPWYLGQTHIALGESDSAAAALEEALRRDPVKADMAEIYQLLGRVYQRSRKQQEALDLWKRFEAAFPNDERVQEQIASILVDEEQLDDALLRFTNLAQISSDPYRRVQFGIRSAELQIRLGRREAAMDAFENLLEQLKPGSWLFGDVRGRIEESFLRTDDYAGLVNYYKAWLKSHPDDIDAMSRIGKYLAWQGWADQAQTWYQKAITKAPTDVTLREALIEQLIGDKQYAAAIAEYEKLAELNRANPGHIERWGMLYLKHEELSEQERRAGAAKVWRTLLTLRPDDALTVSRVADLFRTAQMNDEAIEFYQKAIRLAPDDLQYREYLGEFFHILKRPEDAGRVWEAIAAGQQRTTQNLIRLSEIYKGFGYVTEALATMKEACDMDPEFGDRIRYSTMLRNEKRPDESLAQLSLALEMAVSDEEKDIVLNERIKSYLDAGQLVKKTSELTERLRQGGSAEDWRTLALYQEALGSLPESSSAAREAVRRAPESVRILSVAARVTEKAGLIGDASDANSRLVDLDRRYRTEYLKKVAELERRLGRLDRSLQAGKDLIAAAPDNPENYRFYAELCFSLGKVDSGLEALRRSVRVNPGDTGALTSLAQALADQFKTAEAIELYWRAFKKADSLDDQISMVQTLTDLYLRTNHFDRLIVRLENMSRELSDRRDMTICLANAYQAGGDIAMARETLEELLSEENRDVFLLDELSKLAEQTADYDIAADYQRQINQLTPSGDGTVRLAGLLMRAGKYEAAEELWSGAAGRESEPHLLIRSIDRLIDMDKYQVAKRLATGMVQRDRQDWEALLRLIMIANHEDADEESEQLCRQMLALELSTDAPGHQTKFNRTRRALPGSSTAVSGPPRASANPVPPVIQQEQIVAGIIASLNPASGSSGGRIIALPAQYYRSSGGPGFSVVYSGFAPPYATYYGTRQAFDLQNVVTYGDARCAAVAVSMRNAAAANTTKERLAEFRRTAEAAVAGDHLSCRDWYFASVAATSLGQVTSLMEPATQLARRPDAAAQLAYLKAVQTRNNPGGIYPNSQTNAALSDDQVANMMAAWKTVAQQQPAWLKYVGGIQTLVSELEQVDQADRAVELYSYMTRADASADELILVLDLARNRGDADELMSLTDRLIRLEQKSASSGTASRLTLDSLGTTFAQVASQQVHEKQNRAAAIELLTRFLTLKSDMYQPGQATSSSQTTASYFSTRSYAVFRSGQRASSQKFNTLAPDKYWSTGDMTFFVNLHSLFRNGHENDILNALARHRKSAAGSAAVMTELATAHFRFLMGAQEQAAIHLVRAAELAPEDLSLRINLVRFYQKAGNEADALALLETIDAADQTILKEREMLAMTLAGTLGQTDRVRKAAERLFGLRLSAKEAIALSGKLKTLGMSAMASSLLARTRRAGNHDVTTLVSLMNRYASEGDTDVANQIAHQILRRTVISNPRQNTSQLQSARSAAVRALAKSGQLDQLIERVQTQLKRAPKSLRLHQTLAEYYKAAGKSSEASSILARIQELTPMTPDRMERDAQALERQKKYTEACALYLRLIKEDPRRFSQNYYQYLRAFRSGRRLSDLADAMLEMDLRKLRNNHQIITQTVQTMFAPGYGNAETVDRAMKLLARGWEAFPDYRSEMLSGITAQNIWDRPEMFHYAREGMVPQTPQEAIARPWRGVSGNASPQGDGRMTGTISRLKKSLTGENLTYLTADVEAAVDKYEFWSGGRLLLAILKAKAEKHDEALALLKDTMASESVAYVPLTVAWVVGSELDRLDERYVPVVTDMLAESIRQDRTATGYVQYMTGPQRRLADLLVKAGRRHEARRVISEAAENIPGVSGSPGYRESVLLRRYSEVGTHLSALEFPFLAIRYFEAVNADLVAASGRYANSSSSKQALTTAKSGLARAQKQITPDKIVAWLHTELEMIQGDANADNIAIDLMLKPLKKGIQETAISSAVLDGLRAVDVKNESIRTLVTAAFSDMLKRVPPGESSIAVAAALFSDLTSDDELREQALNVLSKHLEHVADQTSAPGINEIALWIPARIAIASGNRRELGFALADRAEAAANASADDGWLLSILRGRGDIALAAGDKPAAEKAWSKLLDAVLADASLPEAPGPCAIGNRGRRQPVARNVDAATPKIHYRH